MVFLINLIVFMVDIVCFELFVGWNFCFYLILYFCIIVIFSVLLILVVFLDNLSFVVKIKINFDVIEKVVEVILFFLIVLVY